MKWFFLFFMTVASFGCETINDPVHPKKNDLPAASKTEGSVSMRVLWTVSEFKFGANAIWGKKEASKLLFKPLDIDTNSITFNGKCCRNVSFKKTMVNSREYLDKFFGETPQALGLTDETIEVIKTDCTLPGFAEYMHLKDRRLVTNINGVFFFFEPAINY